VFVRVTHLIYSKVFASKAGARLYNTHKFARKCKTKVEVAEMRNGLAYCTYVLLTEVLIFIFDALASLDK
jgi:hypothetical protein